MFFVVPDARVILKAWGHPFAGDTTRRLACGFSGGVVHKVGDEFILKGIPRRLYGGETLDRLRFACDVQTAAAAALPIVPRIVPTLDGASWHTLGMFHWILETFKDGAPLPSTATRSHFMAACDTIAALHRTLSPASRRHRGIPGVQRRLERLREFAAWPRQDRQVLQIQSWFRQVEPRLLDWQTRDVVVQPCHGDIHRGNMFLQGDTVSGLIDFTAAKYDHPAVDYARFLAEFPDAFTHLPPILPPGIDAALVTLLAVSGELAAAAHWAVQEDLIAPDAARRAASIHQRLQGHAANGFFAGVS